MHPRAMATSGTAKPFPPFPGITAGGRPSWNPIPPSRIGIVRGSGIPPSRPRCMTISLAPPTKAGPFSRGQLLVNERDAGRPKRLHRPQLRGGLFRFFWRGTAVLRTAELLQQLQLLSKRKPIVRNLFERLFDAWFSCCLGRALLRLKSATVIVFCPRAHLMPETRASGRMFLCPPVICRQAELQKSGSPRLLPATTDARQRAVSATESQSRVHATGRDHARPAELAR